MAKEQGHDQEKKNRLGLNYYIMLVFALCFFMILTGVLVFAAAGFLTTETVNAYRTKRWGGRVVNEAEIKELSELREWKENQRKKRVVIDRDLKAETSEKQILLLEEAKRANIKLQERVTAVFDEIKSINSEVDLVDAELKDRKNKLEVSQEQFRKIRIEISKRHWLLMLKKMEAGDIAQALSDIIGKGRISADNPDAVYAADLWARLPRRIRAETLSSDALSQPMKELLGELEKNGVVPEKVVLDIPDEWL